MRPIDRQAAWGINYGPGEKTHRGSGRIGKGYVLSAEDQRAIRNEMAAKKAKRAETNRQKRRKKSRQIATR